MSKKSAITETLKSESDEQELSARVDDEDEEEKKMLGLNFMRQGTLVNMQKFTKSEVVEDFDEDFEEI